MFIFSLHFERTVGGRLTSSSLREVSKSARNKLKNYFILIKAPEKESKVGFRRHNIRSMFNRTNSIRVRISFVDSTRRNNSYQPSFGLIYYTNELKLFTLWFSFLTQEQRHFYHDKRVNIQPNKPPCFKRPIMKNHWPSSKLAPALYHTEQFWAEKQNFLELIRARHKHLVPVLHIKLYVRMS